MNEVAALIGYVMMVFIPVYLVAALLVTLNELDKRVSELERKHT